MRIAVRVIFVLVFLLILFRVQPGIGVNGASRLATMESLVDFHTFYIDHSEFHPRTVDKVMVNGHYLSSKPPMLSTIGAFFYWIIQNVTGLKFATDRVILTWIMNFILGLIPQMIFLTYFLKFLRLGWGDERSSRTTLQNKKILLVSLIAAGFGYIGLGYAREINNHTPAAAALFASFYYAYGIRLGQFKLPAFWVLSGFAAGLAVTIDLGALFFCIGLFVYLLLYDFKKTWGYFVVGSLPVLAFHFLLTYLSTGSVVPIYFRRELYEYPGSYWLNPAGPVDRLNEPKHIYLFHMTVGHHGFFSLTPIFVFAVYQLFKEFGQGIKDRFKKNPEVFIIAAAFVGTFVTYLIRTTNYGGLCRGFRWLIVTMPFMFVFVSRYYATNPKGWRIIAFFTALAISIFFAGHTLMAPWSRSLLDRWFTSIGMGY